MELNKIKVQIQTLFNKYRFVVLIIIVGIVLMMIPSISVDSTVDQANTEQTTNHFVDDTEEKLSAILSKITGAGKVAVMLTTSTGEEILYQVDSKTSTRSDASEVDINTVIVSGNDRTESGLVRQINPPVYMGAIVVCQGADDPTVQLAIIDAVSKITGLGTHRISVLKMN